MKRIAILQSNYIPWKGYFDIIRSVDEFIILDDVQYTRRDWRNRNLIKTPSGLHWLTIPVKVKGRYNQIILETEIVSTTWAERHWETIKANYSRSKYFQEFRKNFEQIYEEASKYRFLSEINFLFLDFICKILGITTLIHKAKRYSQNVEKNSRIISICKQTGAESYLTGPAGLDYINVEQFRDNRIRIDIADYSNYNTYKQLYLPFSHNVSIIDLIFCTGTNALDYMKKF